MRITTYTVVVVGLLIWGLPLAIYVAIMLKIYGRGSDVSETLDVAWLFSPVVLVPLVGFALTLAVPAILRWLGFSRAALISAVSALVAAVLLVLVQSVVQSEHPTREGDVTRIVR